MYLFIPSSRALSGEYEPGMHLDGYVMSLLRARIRALEAEVTELRARDAEKPPRYDESHYTGYEARLIRDACNHVRHGMEPFDAIKATLRNRIVSGALWGRILRAVDRYVDNPWDLD